LKKIEKREVVVFSTALLTPDDLQTALERRRTAGKNCPIRGEFGKSALTEKKGARGTISNVGKKGKFREETESGHNFNLSTAPIKGHETP